MKGRWDEWRLIQPPLFSWSMTVTNAMNHPEFGMHMLTIVQGIDEMLDKADGKPIPTHERVATASRILNKLLPLEGVTCNHPKSDCMFVSCANYKPPAPIVRECGDVTQYDN